MNDIKKTIEQLMEIDGAKPQVHFYDATIKEIQEIAIIMGEVGGYGISSDLTTKWYKWQNKELAVIAFVE